MEKGVPRITNAEWKIMDVLWDKSPITSSDIVEILKHKTKWSSTTIYTLISRLVNKKAVAIKEGSSPYVCFPLVSRKDCRSEETRTFLKKVYNGSVGLLLTSFIQDEQLNEQEIEELKKMLAHKQKIVARCL